MKRVFVFLDLDVLIRHFILSGAFDDLEKHCEVTYVIHTDSTSDKKGIYADVSKLNLKRLIYFEVPRKRMGSWDKLYQITALHNQRGTMHYKQRRWQIANVRGWKRTRYYELLSLPGIFSFARSRLLNRMGVFEPLRIFLEKEKPDLVIHPSVLAGYFINELTQLCPMLRIPLIILMNSWDNPSSKAMNTGIPDRLAVWGAQTRQHAIEYLKMPADRIVELGAAQFDVYRDPVMESENELRALFGVPEKLPIILFAGVSKSIDETTHILELDQAIDEGRIPPAHVIFRPHPWRTSLTAGETSFFDVTFKHVTIDPFMEDYYRRVTISPQLGFELADYRVTAKLLKLVSGIVSPLSTLLLEGCMKGVPGIMYSPDNDVGPGNRYIRNSRQMAHFAEFWGQEGIQSVTNKENLSSACRVMLTDHQIPSVRNSLISHAKKYVIMDGPRYPTRLASLAMEVMGNSKANNLIA